jgi:hypothetical protein
MDAWKITELLSAIGTMVAALIAAPAAVYVVRSDRHTAGYELYPYPRHARSPIIYEGTTQIHKLMQAEHALGFRALNGRDGEVSPLCSWAPALAPVQRERPIATAPSRT